VITDTERCTYETEIQSLKKQLSEAKRLLQECENPCSSCLYAIDGMPVCCEDCDDIPEEYCNETCTWWGNVCGLCEHGGQPLPCESNWKWKGD